MRVLKERFDPDDLEFTTETRDHHLNVETNDFFIYVCQAEEGSND